jgi:hypothetical protein
VVCRQSTCHVTINHLFPQTVVHSWSIQMHWCNIYEHTNTENIIPMQHILGTWPSYVIPRSGEIFSVFVCSYMLHQCIWILNWSRVNHCLGEQMVDCHMTCWLPADHRIPVTLGQNEVIDVFKYSLCLSVHIYCIDISWLGTNHRISVTLGQKESLMQLTVKCQYSFFWHNSEMNIDPLYACKLTTHLESANNSRHLVEWLYLAAIWVFFYLCVGLTRYSNSDMRSGFSWTFRIWWYINNCIWPWSNLTILC